MEFLLQGHTNILSEIFIGNFTISSLNKTAFDKCKENATLILADNFCPKFANPKGRFQLKSPVAIQGYHAYCYDKFKPQLLSQDFVFQPR